MRNVSKPREVQTKEELLLPDEGKAGPATPRWEGAGWRPEAEHASWVAAGVSQLHHGRPGRALGELDLHGGEKMKDAKERESERDRKTDTEKDRVQESDRGLSRQKDKGNRSWEFSQRS